MSGRSKALQHESLRELLEIYKVPTLEKLARFIAPRLPKRKAELIAVILEGMENLEELKQLWYQLDSIEQRVIAEVVYSSDLHLDIGFCRAKYGWEPKWDNEDGCSKVKKPSLFCLFVYNGVMPEDLKEMLVEFVPPPSATVIKITTNLPSTVAKSSQRYSSETRSYKEHIMKFPVTQVATEHLAQHDIDAVLRLIETGKIRVSEKRKKPTTASLKTVTKVLQNGDFYPPSEESEDLDDWPTNPGPIKAFAWPLILQSADLAVPSGSKLQLTQAGKSALSSPPHQVIQKAWNSWLKTDLLDEFTRVNTIKGQTGRGKRSITPVPNRRVVITKALRRCPPHEWIAFDEFSRFMRASRLTFKVSRNLRGLYIDDPYNGCLDFQRSDLWNIVQARYLLVFLFEYLATMGLIDVAYTQPVGVRIDFENLWGTDDLGYLSQYDGLLFFRINSLGAWCLGLSEKYDPSPLSAVQEVLRVLPNFEVVAVGLLPPRDVLFLHLFAEQTSDVVWRIQQDKLLDALEEGYSVDEMRTFLEVRTGHSLPKNVEVFLNDLAKKATHLVDLGSVRLIEAQSPELAELIVNNSQLRYICMIAGERHIVVRVESLGSFRRVLHKLGYALTLTPSNGLIIPF